MGIGQDQLDRGTGRVDALYVGRKISKEVQTLSFGCPRLVARTFAPIEHKLYRLLPGNGLRYELQHELWIGRLLALERPGVERAQYFFCAWVGVRLCRSSTFEFFNGALRMLVIAGGMMAMI